MADGVATRFLLNRFGAEGAVIAHMTFLIENEKTAQPSGFSSFGI